MRHFCILFSSILLFLSLQQVGIEAADTTIEITPYTPVTRHAYPPFGMKLMAQTRTIWIIMIRQSEPKLTTIQNTLDNHLNSDGCYLLSSDSGRSRILMEIYCDQKTPDNETVNDYDRATPSFHTTMDYLIGLYTRTNIMVELSVIVRFPDFWYENSFAQTLSGKPSTTGVGDGGMSISEFFEAIHASDAYRRKEKIVPLNKMIFNSNFFQSGVTWGLDSIDQRSNLRDGVYNFNSYAEDIDVYVVDTGIYVQHPEFGGRAQFYYNSVDSINDDCHGHGTHVAGIVGSTSYGVAKNVSLIGVKVLDCTGVGSTFTIISGLNAVVDRVTQTGKRSVINLSLGGDKSTILDSVIQEIALSYNIVVVVAAGNDGDDACHYSPSDLGQSDTILVVSASDYNNMKPLWANKGECVDLSAPGLSILSTWKGSLTAILSGTSMATPFVAGTAAMVLQQKRDYTVAQTCALIRNGATPNVISGATSVGGGRNFLYSLVDPNTIITPNPPSPPAPIPSLPGDLLGSSASRSHIISTIIPLLLIGLLYLC